MKAQVDVICCKSVGTDLSMLDIEDFITEICQLKKEVASLEAKLRERGDKLNREMLSMKAQVDVMCCKSVGTDLSMLDIEDFITEICQLKKEVASLEAKLRERDKLNREDLEKVSVHVTDETEAQDNKSTDQTFDCNAGEQQMLQTPLKMCSIKLMLSMKAQVDVICCKSVGTDLSMLDIEDFITEICQLKKEVASLEAKLRERDNLNKEMLSMKAQVDVICCKSVGTDLSMLDIEDFITEICQLKKEVASLEAKLRERGDKLNREDVEKVSARVTDGTEAQDSVWSVRDQRSRDTQDSELSLTLLCFTDAQDHESTDQTSDCNAGEQQMLQTPLKMCSVKLGDCRNLIESRAEEEQSNMEKLDDDWIDDKNDTKDGTEAQDSVWSVRDQRSRDTQDSELSLSLLCHSDPQGHEFMDQTIDCKAEEEEMLLTPLKMCSVKLVDCRNLIESRAEETTAEEQQQTDEEEQDDDVDDGDFVPSGGAMTIFSPPMLSMKAQVDVICCKSVGTDLSMLDIEDFITEICQLKKEVASLEAKLRERGDKLNREV
ncbi:zinc finger 2-like protein [Labeo rohita]|uniref:Zinc finger 2-like protein n=1 Tax=Labeo rohita TaxID=84645 RepID=A0A498P6M5_LABRO|nr:zinc finger 2-like protein [Labeo rohita]RXN39339.1 zinc finger 2-like protein [Labeo rohita]